MTAAENLARLVVERRAALGLSQEDVARLGGPSTAALRRIENAQSGSFRPKSLNSLDSVLDWQVGTSSKLFTGEIEQPVEEDPPQGSDSETEYWKRRALEAEAKLRKVADVLMGIGGVS